MATAVPIMVNNKKFKSFRAACLFHKVDPTNAAVKIKRGWTIEEAMNLVEREFSLNCKGNLYKIINNINSKIYIGITTYSLNKRFRQHKYAMESGDNTKLYKAMRKYGAENFRIELIKTSGSKLKLRKLEVKYINKYNSIEKGYNTSSGGCGLGENVGTSIEYEGIIYPSLRALANKLGIKESAIYYRIAKGLSLNQAVVPKLNKYENIEYEGLVYKTLKELSDLLEVSQQVLRYRIDNDIALNKSTSRTDKIKYRDKIYKSATQLGKVIGVNSSLIHYRIRKEYCVNGKPSQTGCRGYYKAEYV